jgi:hypothetical protein
MRAQYFVRVQWTGRFYEATRSRDPEGLLPPTRDWSVRFFSVEVLRFQGSMDNLYP